MHLTRRVNTGNVAKYRQLKNLIRKTIKLVVDPPPPHTIVKYNTEATSHYFTPAYAFELFNLQPNSNLPCFQLYYNSTIYPQLVGPITLALTPDATKRLHFQPYKISHHYQLVIYVMMDVKPFSTKNRFKFWTLTKTNPDRQTQHL